MHIVLCHDAVIPPRKYGGTERILYWLSKALLSLGHEVTLIARPGSRVDGARLIELEASTPWEKQVPASADVIHLWGTPATPPKRPFLVTIQGNGRPGERFHPNTVFISRKHAENHGSSHYVYNGLDPSEYPCDEEREDYLVFLAKASWKVKNLEGAIRIARETGLRLEVMGSRDYPLSVQRLLRLGGVRYLGMVEDLEKRAILRKARALLFPVRWHEPFGIALTEALASGCPVFGTPYGSLPEIVTPDVGVLSPRCSDLVRAVREFRASPHACRERVIRNFGHVQMAQSYLRLYEQVIRAGSLGLGSEPQARFQEPAETLLPWT